MIPDNGKRNATAEHCVLFKKKLKTIENIKKKRPTAFHEKMSNKQKQTFFCDNICAYKLHIVNDLSAKKSEKIVIFHLLKIFIPFCNH